MKDFFYQWYLEKDAIRIAKKNNENFDENSKEGRAVIEMMIEDLEDKYRE